MLRLVITKITLRETQVSKKKSDSKLKLERMEIGLMVVGSSPTVGAKIDVIVQVKEELISSRSFQYAKA